jgi:hypothetical protein
MILSLVLSEEDPVGRRIGTSKTTKLDNIDGLVIDIVLA